MTWNKELFAKTDEAKNVNFSSSSCNSWRKMVSHVCGISVGKDICVLKCSASVVHFASGQLVFFLFCLLLLLSHRLTTRFWCLWLAMLKLPGKGELQHVVKAQSFSLTVIPWLLNCETRQSVLTGCGSMQQFSQATLNKRWLRSHILPQSQTDESIVRYWPWLGFEPGSIQHL